MIENCFQYYRARQKKALHFFWKVVFLARNSVFVVFLGVFRHFCIEIHTYEHFLGGREVSRPLFIEWKMWDGHWATRCGCGSSKNAERAVVSVETGLTHVQTLQLLQRRSGAAASPCTGGGVVTTASTTTTNLALCTRDVLAERCIMRSLRRRKRTPQSNFARALSLENSKLMQPNSLGARRRRSTTTSTRKSTGGGQGGSTFKPTPNARERVALRSLASL